MNELACLAPIAGMEPLCVTEGRGFSPVAAAAVAPNKGFVGAVVVVGAAPNSGFAGAVVIVGAAPNSGCVGAVDVAGAAPNSGCVGAVVVVGAGFAADNGFGGLAGSGAT